MTAKLEVSASPAELQDWFEAQGWTDGLPVVPPTPELVAAMVEGSGLAAAQVVGALAPAGKPFTVEKVAVNAVMAGCKPAYMPVILAAVRAMMQPQFNLAALQATTHPVAPFLLVNGSIRGRIGINCGNNALGQGFRANATIGRAVRLVLMNLGGGLPGKTDMATLGSPAKFTFCAGENEEASPWEPLHAERGMEKTESAVLVHGGEAPHNLQDHASATPSELLMTFASNMAVLGSNNIGIGGSGSQIILLLGPEHARILAKHGMKKDDIRAELHKRMRLRFDTMGVALRNFYQSRRPAFDVGPDVTEISYLDDPSQIIVAVAGGPGLHSMMIPGFGGTTQAVLERIAVER